MNHALSPRLAPEQFAISMNHIGVARHQVESPLVPLTVHHAGNFIAVRRNLGDFRIKANFTAKLVEEFDQRLHQRAGASLGKENAPLALQAMNHGIDRSCRKRIAADQERMKAEELA